jgi:regulator of replication initiation timing
MNDWYKLNWEGRAALQEKVNRLIDQSFDDCELKIDEACRQRDAAEKQLAGKDQEIHALRLENARLREGRTLGDIEKDFAFEHRADQANFKAKQDT